MIKTKEVEGRRQLSFNSMGEILDDVEFLASGDPPRADGNWSAGQIVQHVSKVIRYSVEGFPPGRAAWPIRFVAWIGRKSILGRPMNPGITLPAKFAFMAPEAEIGWDEAVDGIRTAIDRAESMRMTRTSPVFGNLTHEQWVQLHCRHAEMHFSFLHPAE
jgi:hypothetical protein